MAFLFGTDSLSQLTDTAEALRQEAMRVKDLVAPWYVGKVKLRTDAKSLTSLSANLKNGHEPLGRIRSGQAHKIMPVDDPELPKFEALFSRILQFYSTHTPRFHQKMTCLISEIIPMTSGSPEKITTRDNGSGFSNHKYRGGIFLSLPRNQDIAFFEGALNLAHECGHQALMVYQCGDPIMETPLRSPIYSVIRKTHRPAIMSLHAAVAVGFMLEWLGEAWPHLSEVVDIEYALARRKELKEDLAISIGTFGNTIFTPLGDELLSEMRSLNHNAG